MAFVNMLIFSLTFYILISLLLLTVTLRGGGGGGGGGVELKGCHIKGFLFYV